MSFIIWNSSAVSTLNVFSEVGRLAISFISSVAVIRINFHYENLSMQYTEIFKVVKTENFQ